ncbi:VWA domain-containing protein [Myxococcota bacterium]|nr:VWA domain-containing protein [Myxococcota bacterium]
MQRPSSRASLLLVLSSLGVAGSLGLALHLARPQPVPAPMQEVPDRFVELMVEPNAVNPDAGEGATARKEEGRVGRKDAALEKAQGQAATSPDAGVLGALRGGEEGGIGASGSLGGLIGTRGEATGSGGLGARGVGLGGGGTAEGLGGLGTGLIGTKGRGSGSGYGHGVAGKSDDGMLLEHTARPRRDVDGTEQFTDHGTSPMFLAEEDRLSTFAVDVDTGSYTLARSSLQGGSLPSAASVRVEEFVNYLDYAYVGPTNGAPFAVNMEAAPHPFLEGHHVLRVGVQGQRLDPDQRKPARLTFLVDTSGSMAGSGRLELAKQSLSWLVDQLGPEDSVAIATYAGSTLRVLEPTPATRKREILAAIDGLRSGGGTAMDSGVELAYQMARDGFVAGAENRVIVLSDGDANIGRTSHEELLVGIRKHAQRGITLSTVGFGRGNYKDTMMEQLADEGDGNYAYVDNLAEGRRVFGQRLSGTVQTIARDVKIQVELNPQAVLAWRLVGYENRDVADQDFRDDAVDGGEIGSGHAVTALYDVILRQGAADMELATVHLRAKAPGPDRPAEEYHTTFAPGFLRAELADASADLRIALGAATFAELLRGSPFVEEVTYAQVHRLVAAARRPGEPEDAELLTLIEAAARLTGPPAVAVSGNTL